MSETEEDARPHPRVRRPSEWYFGRRRTAGAATGAESPPVQESVGEPRPETAISKERYRASRRDKTCAACGRKRPWWYWVSELPQHLSQGGANMSFLADLAVRVGWYRCPACWADYCGGCTSTFHQYRQHGPDAARYYAAQGKHVYQCPYCGSSGIRYTGYALRW